MKDPVRVELDSGEWVDLEPEVTIPMGMAAMYVVSITTGDEASYRGALAPVLMQFGIRAWSFNLTITPFAIAETLTFEKGGFEVAERCLQLYLPGLIRPLAARRQKRSEPGPREDSISPNPDSGTPPPTPSSPSLPESMDGSLYGDQV
jgi:hypothetical protein